MGEKPHKGVLHFWSKVSGSRGDYYTGMFDGHPTFHGYYGQTSYVLKLDGNEIETRNSRYTLGKQHEADA